MASEQLHDRPAELLAQLLRFDTTNPPGGERECVAWAQGLLERLGVQVRILAKEPERPNLLARLSGRGERPPPRSSSPERAGARADAAGGS